MTLKTYIVKYKDSDGQLHVGQSDAFNVRQAINSFLELNPECKRVVACSQQPEW